jgi:DNA-binding HxlR family transcriptional regulator
MKNIIAKLNKTFDNRIRLGIMSILSVNESVDFNTMKELLELTDGNLASHLRALENAEYIQVTKQFIGRKPNTQYQITELGRNDFKEHLDALEKLIKPNDTVEKNDNNNKIQITKKVTLLKYLVK